MSNHVDFLSQASPAPDFPRTDLALMTSVSMELSWLEFHMQLPMLAENLRGMRLWLLAEVEQLGMEPSARLRRAQARARRWHAMARGEDSEEEPKPDASGRGRPEDRWDWDGEWKSGRAQSMWALLRHAAFMSHWGLPKGRCAQEVEEACALAHCYAGIFVGIWAGAAAWSMGGPWLAAAAGLGFVAALRAVIFALIGPQGRALFTAQAAQPWWMLARRCSAGREEERLLGPIGAGGVERSIRASSDPELTLARCEGLEILAAVKDVAKPPLRPGSSRRI